MTRLRGVLSLLAVSILVTAVSCGGDTTESTTTKRSGPTSTTIDPATLGRIPDFTNVLLQLKTQVGSPFEARKVFLSLTGTVTLELRQKDDPDPAKHQSRNNVDRWSYDGTKWKLKAPVVLLANEIPTLDAQMYDPTTLAWSKIPPLGAQALKVLDEIEKPKLGSIGVVGKGVSIRISVEGARGSGHLTADGRTGAVTELARD